MQVARMFSKYAFLHLDDKRHDGTGRVLLRGNWRFHSHSRNFCVLLLKICKLYNLTSDYLMHVENTIIHYTSHCNKVTSCVYTCGNFESSFGIFDTCSYQVIMSALKWYETTQVWITLVWITLDKCITSVIVK